MLNSPIKSAFYDYENQVDEIIQTKKITTIFQSVISLKDGSIIGYEALTRGPENSIFHPPNKLFKAAKVYNKTFQLELLACTKAIKRADSSLNDKFLFLNITPLTFTDEAFQSEVIKEVSENKYLKPKNIIFEITEKSPISDYTMLKKAIDFYLDKGFQISLDDVGSAFADLRTIAETKPAFAKIDMSLIRDINCNSYKQSILKSLAELSSCENIKIIAKGIETEEELKTLINLRIYFGQGFFINKPYKNLLNTPCSVKQTIINQNQFIKKPYHELTYNYIGEIIQQPKAFDGSASCQEVKDYLQSEKLSGACVVKNNVPIGLIMNHSLASALSTQYGFSVFSKRPVSLVMDSNALIVDYYTPIREVSMIAMNRSDEATYDSIIVTRDGKYIGLATIKALLNSTTELEYNYAKELNPLTGLPGNSIIESTLIDYIKQNKTCCVLYFDLDNFKVYNDTYGFESGDKILKFTADLIQNETKTIFPYKSFVGHIGGDDFICIVEGNREECKMLCDNITKKFDQNILNFFNEKDKAIGFIEAVDRKGHKDIFPLTSMSISGLYGSLGKFSKTEEIGLSVANLKKESKQIIGSCYLVKTI